MKQRPKITYSLLLLGLILSLILVSGCSKQEKSATPSPAATITVTDCIGREVKIPAQVNRIACLCPESVYALAMFEQGDKVVAVVGGVKRDLILTDRYPQIKTASVPKSSGAINIEELVRTNPDVVFVKTDTSSNVAEAEKMNKSNIPYLVVDFNNIKEQQYAMAMIGKTVGKSDEAEKYNKYYQNRIKLIQKKVADIPQGQRVKVYHSINEATRTDIKGSLSSEWLNATGAVNVALSGNLKNLEGKYFASLEQILLWNPDVILVNDLGVADYILSNKQWAPLKAVKNKRVYQLPNGISRWGHPSSPETPLAIMWTAKTLYPDKFTDLNMVVETKYFYKEFFGLDLSDEVAAKVLYGGGMRTAR
ncbi:MAG: ABC transporter substrate-binding protein [Syntrophomonas sp.]